MRFHPGEISAFENLICNWDSIRSGESYQPDGLVQTAVRALKHLGFIVARQRGSHIVMRKNSQGCVVPNHKEIKIGTLGGLLKQAGVSVEDFIAALNT